MDTVFVIEENTMRKIKGLNELTDIAEDSIL